MLPVIAAAAVVLLAACGASTGSIETAAADSVTDTAPDGATDAAADSATDSAIDAATEESARRFADQLLAQDFDPVVVTDEDALCMGRLVAADIPTERFEQIIEEADEDRHATEVFYTPAEVDALARGYVECLDLGPLIDLFLSEVASSARSPLFDCLQRSVSRSEFEIAIMKGLISDDNGDALNPALPESVSICPDAVRAEVAQVEAHLWGADQAAMLACLGQLSDEELLAVMEPGLTSAFYGEVKRLCPQAYDQAVDSGDGHSS